MSEHKTIYTVYFRRNVGDEVPFGSFTNFEDANKLRQEKIEYIRGFFKLASECRQKLDELYKEFLFEYYKNTEILNELRTRFLKWTAATCAECHRTLLTENIITAEGFDDLIRQYSKIPKVVELQEELTKIKYFYEYVNVIIKESTLYEEYVDAYPNFSMYKMDE